MSEFKGEAGRIYIERCEGDNVDQKPYEVWFEDFCIIGLGATEVEALKDAVRRAANMNTLCHEALTKTLASNAVSEG